MASPDSPVQRPDPAGGAIRAMSKAVRRQLTDALKANGAVNHDYPAVTNGTYISLLGADAAGLRRAWGLPPKANVRAHMSAVQLSATSLAEAMAAERLTACSYTSGEACRIVAIRCAGFVRRALELERVDRSGAVTPANDRPGDEQAA